VDRPVPRVLKTTVAAEGHAPPAKGGSPAPAPKGVRGRKGGRGMVTSRKGGKKKAAGGPASGGRPTSLSRSPVSGSKDKAVSAEALLAVMALGGDDDEDDVDDDDEDDEDDEDG